MWVTSSVEAIAQRIVEDREAALGDRVGSPPRHIVEKPEPKASPPPAAEPIQSELGEGTLRPLPSPDEDDEEESA
jgi:hypothetical protein